MKTTIKSKTNSKLIGVIFEYFGINGLGHPLFSKVLDSFRKEIQNDEYDLIFFACDEESKKTSYTDRCLNKNVDGVIIASHSCNIEELNSLIENNIPCVSIHDSIQGCPIIISENYHSIYTGVEYLLSLGHKNIGFLGVVSVSGREHASINREKGFIKALKDNNIENVENNIVLCENWEKGSGKEGIKKLLKKNKSLTAIIVASDLLALEAIEYCKEIGLRVPEDISFIGFDNMTITEYTKPALTTYSQDMEKIGKKAAEILIKKINGEDVPDVIQIPTELLIRETVKDLR